ncbi:uncharacterized protein BCR38DRAFT_309124, partial [Pseudomassariella vexata]
APSSYTEENTASGGQPAQALAPNPAPHTLQTDNSEEERPADFVLQPRTSSGPPLSSTSETFDTRSTRSGSISRNANRLSLTLPIALPNSVPSRQAPSSSVPPTPSSESVASELNSPADPNDLIIAIAAQERRVLEIREELSRAEDVLKRLKTRWNSSESQKIRASVRKNEPPRSMAPTSEGPSVQEDNPAVRRSLDMERKKALLLGQGNPREYSRRKIIRGGHTRALSLLSPTKPESGFTVHEDKNGLRSPNSLARPFPTSNTALLSKRATWAPRQTQSPHAVKQIAQDFKQGLWTFVEDLRQATVGDEGISATSNRTSDFPPRMNRANSDQETIRASTTTRGRIPFDTASEPGEGTPSRTSSGSFQDRAQQGRSGPEPKVRKHFSWTPLTFDDFGDDDWSNWDSPTVKTSRWSGSTVNGDIIPAIPEKVDENEGTLQLREHFKPTKPMTLTASNSRRKRSRSELRSPSPGVQAKLGELPSAILNTLTPSKIKRFSSDFIKEWEKSL